MAAMESLSSWVPQANSQPDPPIAHAPKPTGVTSRSEFPSRLVSMSLSPFSFIFHRHGLEEQPSPAVEAAGRCDLDEREHPIHHGPPLVGGAGSVGAWDE